MRRQTTGFRFAVWLVVLGLLFRGLIPSGFMPVKHVVDGQVMVSMETCPHGLAKTGPLSHGGAGGDRQGGECPFAAADLPALPMVHQALYVGDLRHAQLAVRVPAITHVPSTLRLPPPRAPPSLT